MLNVNQISNYLARLQPDSAVQKYAALHKDDPYIMALALSEANRRKAAKTAQHLNAPEQPKVVDQAIAGMAAPMPEDVGIGQLPAGNMEFAAGGIVAFGSGGDVPRYQAGGQPRPSTYGTPYEIPGLVQPSRPILLQAGAAENTPLFQRLLQSARSEGERYKLAQAQQRITMGVGTQADRDLIARAAQPDMGAASLEEQAAMTAALNTPPIPQVKKDRATTVIPTSATPAASTARPGPGTAGAQTPTLLGGPGTTEQAQAGIVGLASTPSTLRREFESFMPEGGTTLADIERQTREVGEEGIAAAKTRKETREKQLAEMGLFGVEQEKRLGERKGRIEKQEKELGGLSLLQAGLAMMSGTSPNALQNIGVGAQVGLKTYGEGIDKLENAKEKLDDAFGRLEAARRSERILTDKEKADLESDYNKAKIDAKKLTLDGARQAYGFNQQQAGKLFEAYTANQRLSAELGSKEKIAREQMEVSKETARMLPAELRGAMLLGTGTSDAERLRSGLPALMEIKDRLTDTKLAELYTKHVADAKKDMSTPMTPEDFAKTIRAAMGAYRPTVADVQNTRPR